MTLEPGLALSVNVRTQQKKYRYVKRPAPFFVLSVGLWCAVSCGCLFGVPLSVSARACLVGEPVPWCLCGWSACGMCCLWLWIGCRWDVLPVVVSSLGAGCRMCCLSDGLPVAVSSLGGAVCLCRMVCRSSSGEPVGWSACGGLPVAVDWWPVVSNLDTLPACEGVAVVSVGRMVSLWDVLPVVAGMCGRGQYPRHSASL